MGKRNRKAKLGSLEQAAIYRRRKAGESRIVLAAEHGVTDTTIDNVVARIAQEIRALSTSGRSPEYIAGFYRLEQTLVEAALQEAQ